MFKKNPVIKKAEEMMNKGMISANDLNTIVGLVRKQEQQEIKFVDSAKIPTTTLKRNF